MKIKNNIFVNYELTHNTNVAMQIMSIEGKVVYADVLTDKNGVLEINTSNLGDGIYFINLKSESLNIKSSADVDVDQDYTLGIRPEHIYICEKEESDLEVTVDS